MAPEKAREKALNLLAEVQDGGDPSARRKAAREAETVADLAERYLDEHAEKKKRPRSVVSDRTLLRLHVLPRLSSVKLADLSRADVAKLHHDMRATPGAANRTLALLSKMMNLAGTVGNAPGRLKSLPACREVQGSEARALSFRRRTRPPGRRADGAGADGNGGAERRCGSPFADPHRLSALGNPHAAMGARRLRWRLPATTATARRARRRCT